MNGWMIVGFLGQFVFGARFIIQWFKSEKRKESYVPVIFWYLSIIGGLILFAYAIHIKDIVFTIGQGAGIFIYFRNLVLIRRKASGETG